MDLNTNEKAMCRDDPIGAIQLYMRRTGLGLNDARDALEQELGMNPIVYRRVRDRLAFAAYYQDNLWDKGRDREDSEKHLQFALKFWRKMKSGETSKNSVALGSWYKHAVKHYYELADRILDLDDISLDEKDPRNWNTKTI